MRNISDKLAKPTSTLLFSLLSFGLFLAYWILYLKQPSAFGFLNADGQPFDRLTDLMVMPAMAIGMVGDGAQPVAILDRLPYFLGAAGWLAIALFAGLPLTRRALPSADRVLVLVLSVFVGLAILSSATLAMGLVGGLGSRWPLLTVVVAMASFSAWDGSWSFVLNTWTSKNSDVNSGPQDDPLRPGNIGGLWLRRLLPLAVAGLVACYAFGSVLPPWEFDVLEYHLQTPKEYWQAGEITYFPHNVYANMPLGAEMHSLAAMTLIGGEQGWWSGGLVGKLVLGLLSVLTALLVGRFVALNNGTGAGWAVAGLLLAVPGNMHVAMAGLIDMVMAGYIAAALVAYWLSTNSFKAGQGRVASVVVIGVLAGGAAACKYPGLLVAVLPLSVGLSLRCIRAKNTPKANLMLLTAFGCALLLTSGLWLIRNFVWTGNPVYPIANSIFAAPGFHASGLENWNRVHQPQSIADGSTFSIPALWDALKKPLYGSGFTSPFLVFAAAAGGIAWLRNRRADWLLGNLVCIAWIFTVWWLATHRIDRFWLPALPLFAFSAGYGIRELADRGSPVLTNAFVLLGVAIGLLQGLAGAGPHDNRYLVDLSVLEADSLMENSSGGITTTAWINSNLSAEDDKLLCVGFAKPYLVRVPCQYATCFNLSPAEQLLAGKTPAQQLASLQAAGITHLLFDWGEIQRYRSPGNYGFSTWPEPQDVEDMLTAGFVKRLTPPFDPRAIEILEVLPSALAP